MTERERILCALSGVRPDRIAWVPRLEFWYRGNKYTNTLPDAFKELKFPEVIEKLNVGWYANIPDWTDLDSPEDALDLPLGILRSRSLPYDTILEGIDRCITIDGNKTTVEYITPLGSVNTETVLTDDMKRAGVSAPYVTSHPIKGSKDIDVVGYIFSHLKVIPKPKGYLLLRNQIGEKGIATAFASANSGPIHHMLRVLMPMESFFFTMIEEPLKLYGLAEQMQEFYKGIKEIAAGTPAEVVIHGGNYDDSITYPPFFREHILPDLKEYSDTLHQCGKFMASHTDGENQDLLTIYPDSGIDIAESLCPAPMTKCSLDKIHEAFKDRITIWGGIPSVLLCSHSCNWNDFKRFIDSLLLKYGHESHFILGVSDMVTADADLDRLQYITERVHSLI